MDATKADKWVIMCCPQNLISDIDYTQTVKQEVRTTT